MIEFISRWGGLFLAFFLLSTAFRYYVEKQPLKESIGDGLIAGTFFAAGLTLLDYRYQFDYQLIIIGCIVIGIMLFLLQTVNRYYVHKEPLEESIKEGLIGDITKNLNKKSRIEEYLARE